MNIESKHMIALLTIVFLASGCTDTGGNTEDDTSSISPVQVNEFSILPQEARSGQQVNARMILENTGESDINNANARLFGPAWLNGEDRDLNFGSLEASSETSFPEEESVRFKVPEVDDGKTSNYNINARIVYDYKTTASTEFKFVSEERFRDQGYSPSDPEIDNSPGPIKLGIQGQTPIRFNSDNDEESREVCVTVENEGSGKVFSGEKSGVLTEGTTKGYGENKVSLTVEKTGDNELELAEGYENTVKLIDGQRAWSCYKLYPPEGVETTVNLNIEADYNYLQETSTGLTVEGR